MAARRACRYRSRASDHEKRAESTDVEHGKVRYRSRVRLSRDDPDRMAGMRDDCRIASRGVGRHLCADRDSRPSSLRASASIRGADCHHGHGVRMVMGQRRCTFRPARVPERRSSQRYSAVLARGAVGAVRDSTQYLAALASGATAHLGARRCIRRPRILSRRCGAGGRSFHRSGCSARRSRNRLGVHLAGRACDCKPLGWRNAPFSSANRRRRHE